MKIMIIDFSKSTSLADSIPPGHNIILEKNDGGEAYRVSGEVLPDKIFINYKAKPSHGRQTALSIKGRKKTADIPIYFVDGEMSENEKIKDIGKPITISELQQYLDNR